MPPLAKTMLPCSLGYCVRFYAPRLVLSISRGLIFPTLNTSILEWLGSSGNEDETLRNGIIAATLSPDPIGFKRGILYLLKYFDYNN